MKYTAENIDECYSPRVEALIKDWEIWMNAGGGYETRAQFWAAAETVHGITDDEFSNIIDVRFDNFLKMYHPWRSDMPRIGYAD
jgi:hypothetical protein